MLTFMLGICLLYDIDATRETSKYTIGDLSFCRKRVGRVVLDVGIQQGDTSHIPIPLQPLSRKAVDSDLTSDLASKCNLQVRVQLVLQHL